MSENETAGTKPDDVDDDEADEETEAPSGAGVVAKKPTDTRPRGSKAPSVAVETEAERRARHRANVRTVTGAVLLALFIRIVLFEAFEIEGPSMEPTLLNGDRVVVSKSAFGLFLPFMHEAVTSWGMPEVGDVVILNSPYDGIDIVKRVIGIPGDRVEIRENEVFRNGESIRLRVLGPCHEDEGGGDPTDCEWVEEGSDGETWRISYSLLSPTESHPEREVPPGHIFVLGDHRDHSNDSRNPRVGMIPIGRVKGRVMAIYWSSDARIRWDRMFSAVD